MGRYQKNVKRNDMELRDEADVLHRRQPYAVLYALFFLPSDACWDGMAGHSSFAHAVFTFRKRAGRRAPDTARTDLFEKVFIGLFAADGSLAFFDVEQSPPKNQPPAHTLTLGELVESMQRDVVIRNEGVAFDERYAPDDPLWAPPAGSLPDGIEAEPVLEVGAGNDDDADDDALDDAPEGGE